MRLIDADALKKKADMLAKELRPMVSSHYMAVAVWDIDAAPTIDAVPVIRCPDCKYSFVVTDQDGGRHLCCAEHGRRDMKDDDFCSYGELRK